MIVAIDGPAASGKGTLARMIARELGLPHLDTGLLYRAVAYALEREGIPSSDAVTAERVAMALDLGSLPEERQLRSPTLGEGASVVSAHPGVRQALLEAQRGFAAQPCGAVLDGRDIGTVICPQADLKIFVVADPRIRAERRLKDLRIYDPTLSFEAVLEEILKRDARDSGRGTAPLLKADDALVVDTSELDPEQALAKAMGALRRPIFTA